MRPNSPVKLQLGMQCLIGLMAEAALIFAVHATYGTTGSVTAAIFAMYIAFNYALRQEESEQLPLVVVGFFGLAVAIALKVVESFAK